MNSFGPKDDYSRARLAFETRRGCMPLVWGPNAPIVTTTAGQNLMGMFAKPRRLTPRSRPFALDCEFKGRDKTPQNAKSRANDFNF
jgi:hypothetical protein